VSGGDSAVTGARIEVTAIEIVAAGERARVQATVGSGAASETWWFGVPWDRAGDLQTAGNPFLVATLPLAAAVGGTVAIDAPVDARLLHNLQRVLEIWRGWYPWVRPVRLACDNVLPASAATRMTAAFLSGGVDSLFTALRPRDAAAPDERVRIDEFITVHGFDIPLANEAAFQRLRERHRGVAGELGCSHMDIVTNLRETRLREVSWGWIAHGCALAAAALVLESRYGRVLIPATGGYHDPHPWGSHPLTDPLLSTARTTLVHDGAAFTRTAKIRLLTESPHAPGVLRVCWESRSDENCGRCGKCLRTMATLECMGALARFTTFPAQQVDVRALSRVRCTESWDYREFGDLHELARRAGRPDIARAARQAMRRSRRRERWHHAVTKLARVVRSVVTLKGAGRPRS